MGEIKEQGFALPMMIIVDILKREAIAHAISLNHLSKRVGIKHPHKDNQKELNSTNSEQSELEGTKPEMPFIVDKDYNPFGITLRMVEESKKTKARIEFDQLDVNKNLVDKELLIQLDTYDSMLLYNFEKALNQFKEISTRSIDLWNEWDHPTIDYVNTWKEYLKSEIIIKCRKLNQLKKDNQISLASTGLEVYKYNVALCDNLVEVYTDFSSIIISRLSAIPVKEKSNIHILKEILIELGYRLEDTPLRRGVKSALAACAEIILGTTLDSENPSPFIICIESNFSISVSESYIRKCAQGNTYSFESAKNRIREKYEIRCPH